MKTRQITVEEMAPHIHYFGVNENKVDKLSFWLAEWIREKLKLGLIKPYDFLPSKGDLAFHIGVSKGTMQNVFRCVEDCGLIESKQRIGTYIKNPYEKQSISKLTSKRELAVEIIKKYLADEGYKIGDCLVSTRKLAQITGISNTTLRMAINCLISEKIIAKKNNAFIIQTANFEYKNIHSETLVEKIAGKLKVYISDNFPSGSKLPTNTQLAEEFNVSIKTIHDAIKLLSKEGVLYSRRGRYGTIVSVSSVKNLLYDYEKTELKIRTYIAENCEIGSKLPSIINLSKIFEVSPKTIKKALDNLADDGYLAFTRGRYGGTFVTDIPQKINETYTWLAISPDYIANT